MKFKQLVYILIFIPGIAYGQYPLDSLLNELDDAIKNHEIYTRQKEHSIKELKNSLETVQKNSVEEYDLNAKLFEEFRPYILDSAIFYKNRNIEIASQLNDIGRLAQSKLQLANLMASTGMYMEAVDLIKSIRKTKLPDSLLIDYYDTYRHVYSELAYYTQDNRGAQRYWDISNQYSDSLNNLLTPDDELYYSIKEADLRNAGNFEEALEINNISLENNNVGTRAFAIACYNRSFTFRQAGNKEGEKYFLALSALSDIISSTKDHASLWMLAEILYDENDMERAYNYIRFSWSETVVFNARLRSLQSAVILSLIDLTYQATVENKNAQLQRYLIIISALVVLLMGALIYIYSQMKRLTAARKNLQVANGNLKKLNIKLEQVNSQLHAANSDLSESNLIKEQYIGHFIELCSTYIDKIDGFRRMVNKKVTAGQIAELLGVIRSRDMLDSEIEELYRNFDKAFLQIFPHFVEKVNELFVDNEKFELKNNELLNVELRILALIRLGIKNSSQIADFMRYSVNTIYNYRAKIKNKTIYRDEFEEMLMTIR
jgi:hypothetical protein